VAFVVGDDQIENTRTFKNVNPGTAAHSVDQSSRDFCSRLISVRVYDPPA
jgi:hypothetical protein